MSTNIQIMPMEILHLISSYLSLTEKSNFRIAAKFSKMAIDTDPQTIEDKKKYGKIVVEMLNMINDYYEVNNFYFMNRDPLDEGACLYKNNEGEFYVGSYKIKKYSHSVCSTNHYFYFLFQHLFGSKFKKTTHIQKGLESLNSKCSSAKYFRYISACVFSKNSLSDGDLSLSHSEIKKMQEIEHYILGKIFFLFNKNIKMCKK